MKATAKYLVLLPLLLAAIACVPENNGDGSVEMSFECSFESGLNMLWREGDALSVFSGSCPGGERYLPGAGDAGKSAATFTGPSVGRGPYYVLYPYDDAATYGNGAISCRLPAVQKYTPGTYGQGSCPLSAYSRSRKLHFNMLGRGLCLQLSGTATVKSIQLTVEGSSLWGDAVINMKETSNPVLTVTSAADEEHSTLTLDCGNGQALSQYALPFWFCVPPGSLNRAFTIRVIDNGGGEMLLSRDKGLSIQRGQTCVLDAVEYCRTASPFLSEAEFGIYDLSHGDARPMRVYSRGEDQLALRQSATGTSFRIQNLKASNALTVSASATEWTRGKRYRLTVRSVGKTDVTDFDCEAVLERVDSGRLWFEDEAGSRGIIIAYEL